MGLTVRHHDSLERIFMTSQNPETDSPAILADEKCSAESLFDPLNPRASWLDLRSRCGRQLSDRFLHVGKSGLFIEAPRRVARSDYELDVLGVLSLSVQR